METEIFGEQFSLFITYLETYKSFYSDFESLNFLPRALRIHKSLIQKQKIHKIKYKFQITDYTIQQILPSWNIYPSESLSYRISTMLNCWSWIWSRWNIIYCFNWSMSWKLKVMSWNQQNELLRKHLTCFALMFCVWRNAASKKGQLTLHVLR